MITQEETAKLTNDDDDGEPDTSKGGDARTAAPAGSGDTSDIKVGSPTDGSGITAKPQE